MVPRMGCPRWQRGCSLYTGELCCAWCWWDGNMGGEGKPAYSCGHGGMSRKWAPSKSGRSILWWKDESWTGNFSCVEVWGRSKLWSFVYQKLHCLESPRLKVLDKLKGQATQQLVMWSTVTEKSGSKESLEDRLRALVSHTELEPMARHSERSRLSFGLGQTGADRWIWVISVSSWACVYRQPSVALCLFRVALSRGRREADQGQSPLEHTESWTKMRACYSPVPISDLLIRKAFNN